MHETLFQTCHQCLHNNSVLLQYYLGRNGAGIEAERQKLGLDGNRFCCGPLVVYSQPAVASTSQSQTLFNMQHNIS